MGWIYVFVASALEILGVVGLKLFSRRKSLFNLALFSGGFALSYLFLYFSLAYLDMSIAYAAWMGLVCEKLTTRSSPCSFIFPNS